MWSALNSIINKMPNYKQSENKSENSKNTHIICFFDPKKILWQHVLGHLYNRLLKYSIVGFNVPLNTL